jgi:hypothetical protein
MFLTLLASVIGITVAISFLLMLRYRPPNRDRAAVLYERFVNKTGITPAIGETPAAFAARASTESNLAAEDIEAITSSYLDARYGAANPAALSALESAVTALSRRASRHSNHS